MSENVNLASLIAASGAAGREFATSEAILKLDEFATATRLGENLDQLSGRSVILLTDDALAAGAALIELDGLARRIVLCPPDFDPAHLRSVARDSQADGSSLAQTLSRETIPALRWSCDTVSPPRKSRDGHRRSSRRSGSS